jgi:CHASE2 domain-containing sensor protein
VNLLTVHLWVAFLVAALAVLAVWQRTGRRVTLYAVTLQILIGIVLMVQGLKVPWYHPALAVVGWAGYMVANAMSRREGARRNALIIAGISSLVILVAYYIGMEAVKHGYAG